MLQDIANIAVLSVSVPWSVLLVYALARFAAWKPGKKDSSYTPSTSFVIAAWKEKRLGETIESVAAQDYPKKKIEIIVVGGGDEETVRVGKKFHRDGKIKFFEEKRRAGKWRALNRGVKAARGEIIAFTDADCKLSRKWLRNMNANLADEKVKGVVGNVSGAGSGHIPRALSVLIPIYTVFAMLVGAPFFFGQSSVFRSEIFRKIKFRESIVEDLVLASELQSKRMKMSYENDAKLVHRYPTDLSGLFNANMRVYVGSYRSLIKNPFVAFSFSMAVVGLAAGSIFAVLYSSAPFTGAPMSLLFFLLPAFATVYFLAKMGRVGDLRHLHKVALVALVYSVMNAVALFYYISGKTVEWKIYRK